MKKLMTALILLLLSSAALSQQGAVSLWEHGRLVCSAFKADLNELGEAMFNGDPIVTAAHCVGNNMRASVDNGVTTFPVVHVWNGGSYGALNDWAYFIPDEVRATPNDNFSAFWAMQSLPITLDPLELDEDVRVAAYPSSHELKVYRGYVSDEKTTMDGEPWNGMVSIVVPGCTQGCSGSPIMNLDGEVAAITVGGFGISTPSGRLFFWFSATPTVHVFREAHLAR